ncbi:hypothetical protein AR687_08840 [Flavobacteriaceae bacterium CRH]|nr:hypothetical protein AR687_08840 [Flavobacteriaceae bacterium CRH]
MNKLKKIKKLIKNKKQNRITNLNLTNMGNVRIKVDIKGGTAPVPVLVFIDKVNSNHDTCFKRDISFNQSVIIDQGEYNVIVSGENPIDGQTDILVEYTDNNGQTKKKSYNIKIPIYSRIFKVFI